jgi:iron complex transport system substrate-binding protein
MQAVAAGAAALLLAAAGSAAAHTVTDMLGRSVTVPDRPLRVVSLAPSLTEAVFALGRGDWLVGVTDLCDYPEAAREKPRVGGIGAPDLERIVAARPDLVLLTAEANARVMVAQLAQVGIPSFAVTPSSYRGVLSAIQGLASVLHAEEAGSTLVHAVGERMDALRERVARRRRPRALFLIWTDPMIAAGRTTFLQDLIELAGGANVARGAAAYPRLGWEEVLAAAPEVILVASHRPGAEPGVEPALLEAWQPWRAVPAVRAGRILGVHGDLVLRPGPRIAEAAEHLARALHPGAFEAAP